MGLVALVLFGCFMIATDQWFPFIDDEIAMLSTARAPVLQILERTIEGGREHAHPPLHDLFLHGWWRLTGGHPRLLRVSSIILYVFGLYFCACTAEILAGEKGWWTGLLSGFFWPFGFLMGRLQAWYVLSFFFAAWMTWAYFRVLRDPSTGRWISLIVATIGLVYSNYFGWAMIGLLSLHFLAGAPGERDRWVKWGASIAMLLIAFSPFFLSLFRTAGSDAHVIPGGLAGKAAYGLYNSYVFVAGESISPWVLPLGLPMIFALLIFCTLTLWHANRDAKFLMVSAFLLIGVMTVLGIVASKRILTLGPWLVIAIATSLASAEISRSRWLLRTSASVVVVLSAFGMVTRESYAAPRWAEPWGEIARQETRAIQKGVLLVASNPSLSFYMTYELQLPASASGWRFAGLAPLDFVAPGFMEPPQWITAQRPIRDRVDFIRSSSREAVKSAAKEADVWLHGHCSLLSTDRYVRDPGFEWKQELFPGSGQLAWRIEIFHFHCDASNASESGRGQDRPVS